MKFSEALGLVQANAKRNAAPELRFHLAVGFTANQFAMFVTALAASRASDRRVVCTIGPYGDVIGALGAPEASLAHAALVALEWADIDPRLGLRRFAAATGPVAEDVVKTAAARLDMLRAAIERQAQTTPVVLALPTLPLPPAFLVPQRQMGFAETSLRLLLLQFAERCLLLDGVSIINATHIDRQTPILDRRAAAGEMGADMPYQTAHLAALASAFIECALPSPALKGLITDLDDTLWRGLVGEVGRDGVSWNLDAQSHIHAIYQQMLNGLASQGVLLAVVSKNAPENAKAALSRPDLLVSQESLFPIEIGWGAKSDAVERVLSRWNIGADSVAFVDDSPMEIAEVQARFPGITGLLFPTRDDEAALALIERIRDLFGRAQVTRDDLIRAASIRRSAEIADHVRENEGGASEAFLKSLDAKLTFQFQPDPNDARPLELVNKTNQFNLNGRRIQTADWKRWQNDPARFTLAVAYADKFGPLGTISVVTGWAEDSQAVLTSWVLSCRAFSRRVEHATLAVLSERLGVTDFRLQFAPTEKNGPLRTFLTELGVTLPAEPDDALALPVSRANLPDLYDQREVYEHA